MDNALNHFGTQFLSFAWPMLWQSSLLIAVVFAADLLLARKLRASVRHALWLVVLAKLLLPPTLALPTSAAWWLFPAKPIILPAAVPLAKASGLNTSVVVYDDVPPPGYTPEPVPQTEPPRPRLNRAGWTLLATGAVSVGLLFWLLLRWWQLIRKVQKATPAENFPRLLETLSPNWSAGHRPGTITKLLKRAGTVPGAPVRVRIVDAQMSPAVCGLFRPVVLLPRILAENLSAPQLRAVLLHELIHLRRRDIWVNCAQSLLQILYWWHPLVWIANARIRRVREEAVDDAVMLALAGEADTYAPTLLEVAKLAFYRPLMSLGIIGIVGIIESRSALRQRVERLLDFRAPRKAGLSIISFFGIFLFSAVALPMGQGPAQIVRAPAETQLSAPAPVQPPPPAADPKPRLPVVLINAAIYHIPPQALEKLVAGLDLHSADTNGDAWWSASYGEYSKLQGDLTNSNFTPISRPRILTSSDAEFFVGNTMGKDSFGTDLRCALKVNDEQIDLDLHGKITDHPAAPVTNQFAIKASAPNYGGIVVRFPDDTNNTVIFLNVEIQPAAHPTSSGILTNPEFETALNALKQRTGRDTLGEPEITELPLRHENQGEIFPPRPPIQLSSTNTASTASPEDSLAAHPTVMAFKLDHPPAYDSLEKELQSAGVQLPATGVIYNRGAGIFAVHGTPDQVMLASGVALKLNGHASSASLIGGHASSPADPDSNQNAADDSGPLFSRTFNVNPLTFSHALDNAAPQNNEVLGTTNLSAKVRAIVSQFGVNLLSPAGKSIFFNDRLGIMFVTATKPDLEAIECALGVLSETPLQIHIKTRFIEVPKDTLKNFNDTLNAISSAPVSLTGIITSKNAKLLLRALASAKGAETFGEPEITVLSGRHVQMRATGFQTVVTNLGFAESFTNQEGKRITDNSIEPQTSSIETGPIMDAVSHVLEDGYTIELSGRAFETTFLGYANTEKLTPTYITNSQGEVVSPPAVLPVFEVRHSSFHVNLFDDQTLVLAQTEAQAELPYPAPNKERDAAVAKYVQDYRKKSGDKDVIVLITATIVDPAGSRVHSDKELPFRQSSIPPQPSVTNDVDAQFSAPTGRRLATPGANTNIVYTSPGRQAILSKLDHIRFNEVSYDYLPLTEVLKQISQQVRLRDPERKGINFLINNNPALSGQPATASPGTEPAPTIDPTTGLPVPLSSATTTTNGAADIGSTIIKIPSLTDVRLADLLDALVLVADRPIKYSVQDFAVVFSAKRPETPQLFTRTFRIDPNTFYKYIETDSTFVIPEVSANKANLSTNQNGLVYIMSQGSPATPSALARAFFTHLGVNLLSPPGKSVFFNDRLGLMFVKATKDDLDTIERSLQLLNTPDNIPPSVHLKTRFISIPKDTVGTMIAKYLNATNQNGNPIGLFSANENKTLLKLLGATKGVKTLSEPEITVMSGRQTQVLGTESVSVTTRPAASVQPNSGPQTNFIEVGPILDLVPYVLGDGYNINLTAIPSLAEFVNGEYQTRLLGQNNRPATSSSNGLPPYSNGQLGSTVDLRDGQTLLLTFPDVTTVPPVNDIPGNATDFRESESTSEDLLILVTATLVNEATGVPIHDVDVPAVY